MPSTCFFKSTSHRSVNHTCGSFPLTFTCTRRIPWPSPRTDAGTKITTVFIHWAWKQTIRLSVGFCRKFVLIECLSGIPHNRFAPALLFVNIMHFDGFALLVLKSNCYQAEPTDQAFTCARATELWGVIMSVAPPMYASWPIITARFSALKF